MSTKSHIPDVSVMLCLALAAGLSTYAVARQVTPLCLDHHLIRYFEGDCIPRFELMTDRHSNHNRTNVHPLFTLLSYSAVTGLHKASGVAALTAVLMLLSIASATWLSTLYVLLRLDGCRLLDAAVFSVLAATSSAATFWFVVPETYAFGAPTILLALLCAQRRVWFGWCVPASVLSLSVTTTNWMSGLAATFARLSVFRALLATALSLACFMGLRCVQQRLFPDVRPVTDVLSERSYVSELQGRRTSALLSFFYHSMTMPMISVTSAPGYTLEPPFNRRIPRNVLVLTTQGSTVGSSSLWGVASVVIWSLLLALGAWGASRQPFRVALLCFLAGQLALHLAYGGETFLYSVNFIGPLVVLSSWGLRRSRKLALALASALVVCNVFNNYSAVAHVIALGRAHVCA